MEGQGRGSLQLQAAWCRSHTCTQRRTSLLHFSASVLQKERWLLSNLGLSELFSLAVDRMGGTTSKAVRWGNGSPVGRHSFVVALAHMLDETNVVQLTGPCMWGLAPGLAKLSCSSSDLGHLAFKVRKQPKAGADGDVWLLLGWIVCGGASIALLRTCCFLGHFCALCLCPALNAPAHHAALRCLPSHQPPPSSLVLSHAKPSNLVLIHSLFLSHPRSWRRS